jgi:hypothetical protein
VTDATSSSPGLPETHWPRFPRQTSVVSQRSDLASRIGQGRYPHPTEEQPDFLCPIGTVDDQLCHSSLDSDERHTNVAGP